MLPASQELILHNGPLVSFVVPCYRFAHLLAQCINSILAQTYRNFEILIMDNCSPDNTPEVARSFHDPRVKHIRNEVNLGHIRNFNKGIRMSRGEYVWLVSADDFLASPDVLSRYVDMMENNPNAAYVFCRAYEVNGLSEVVGVLPFTDCGKEDRIWERSTFLKHLIKQNCIVMSSVMVRKTCYDYTELFPLDMPYAGDWYLWCSFALRYGVAYLSQPMVCWRIHDESLSSVFARGANPVCFVDEVNVLLRVAREAELAGMSNLRGDVKASVADHALRALTSRPGDSGPALSETEFEKILLDKVKDPRDRKDIRARVYVTLGDEQYQAGEYVRATGSYWCGLKLRPWWMKSWAKYLLLRAGSLGIKVRQLVSRTVRGYTEASSRVQ